MKNIYIEPDEEIVSIIDRLINTEEEEVNLVVPIGAQLWQSSINLKLLKREADNADKKVTLIVSDGLDAEAAEKIGFTVKKEKNLPVELIQEEHEEQGEKEIKKTNRGKKDMISYLIKELRPGEKLSNPFAFLKPKEKKQDLHLSNPQPQNSKRRMADIINPMDEVKIISPYRGFLKKKPIKPSPILSEDKSIEKTEEIFSATQEPIASKWPKFFVIFIIFAVLVAGLVGYLVLPTTEITLSPKTEKISFDLLVIGSRNISQVDESLNKIPLQEIEVEKTKKREFSATGEKQLNEKAKGFITIYNEYSSDEQPLLVRTRFESSGGKVFRTTKAITVPGAKIEEGKIVSSSIDVEVIADEAGEDYNIDPTNFNIPGFKGTPKYASFYGKSEEKMEGGYVGKVKVVSAEDIERAEESLTEDVKNEVKQAFQEQIPTDLKVIEEELKEEVTKLSSSNKEGDQIDKFTMEIKATIKAFLFKEDDLKNLADLNIISQISEDKISLPETQQIDIGELTIDWANGEVSFPLYIEEEVAWKIDTQLLKKDLAGLTELEVRGYLSSQEEIGEAKVSFWPFWVKRIPTQEKKIKIIINGVD